MKAGVRALGVAFSGDNADARLVTCAAVVRADRVVDGLILDARQTANGAATAAVRALLNQADRPDAAHVLLAGVAPPWFDVLDLDAVHDAAGRPVVAVSFEASTGLADALDREFTGDARTARRSRYDTLPPRQRVETGKTTLFFHALGCSDDVDTVDADNR